MSSSYVNDLRLEEIGTGDQSGTWGTTTNTNLELIGEALGYGTQDCFTSDADATTTVADGATDPARSMYFKVTSSATLTATRTLTMAPNTISRVMFIENATTGSQSITISQGSGANVTIATGKTAVVYLDGAGSGAAVVDAMALVDPGVTDTLAEVLVAGNATGGTDIAVGTGDDITFADSSKAIFGAGSDLQIFSEGSTGNSFISEEGSGTLFIQGTDLRFRSGQTPKENFITAIADGAVTLYHNNAAKLATTSTGIDVTGTVTADGLTVDGDVTVTGASAISLSSEQHITYQTTSTNATAGDHIFKSYNTEIMRIDGNNNRVGIGTASPAYKLDISGTAGTNSISLTRSTSATNNNDSFGNFYWTNSSGNNVASIAAARQSATDDAYLTFNTRTASGSNTERMRIDSSGNVGIGRTNPSSYVTDDNSLYVKGQIRVDGVTNTAALPSLTLNDTNSGLFAPAANEIAISTGAAERLRIDSSGNVGIGETSPLGKLHIKGADTGATASAQGNSLVIEDSENGLSILSSSSGAGYINFGDSDDNNVGMVVYDHSSNSMRFWINASEAARIDASGRVGINRTPSISNSKLEVGGADDVSLINVEASGVTGGIGIGSTGLQFFHGSSAKMRINSSGNVGIGVSPGVALDINRATSTASYARVGNGGNVQTYMGVAGDNLPVLGTYTNHPLRLNINTLEVARFDTSGNLLVGKTSTSQTVEGIVLQGADGRINSSADGNVAGIFNRLTNDGDIFLFRKDGSDVGSIGVNSDKMYFAGANEGIAIDDSLNAVIPVTNTGAGNNDAVDLGASGGPAFRDLYLSGQAIAGDGSVTAPAFRGTDVNTGIYFPSAGVTAISRNGVEGCRMDASGNLLVGQSTSSAPGNSNTTTGFSLKADGQFFASSPSGDDHVFNINGTGNIISIRTSGTQVGTISVSGSATAYNTSSDYRLKENVVAMSGATERLKQLKPSRFNFIADPNKTVDGFLAHEVQNVVPEAITGTKDAMRDEEYEVTPAVLDDEGNVITEAVMGTRSVPKYQGIDQSKLVPLLVATIQELEARIAALEGAN